MYNIPVFDGDAFIDANGRDVTNAVTTATFPVAVWHTPTKRYLDTDILEAVGGPRREAVCASLDDLAEHQLDKW